MITERNFETALQFMGFTHNGKVYEKQFPAFHCALRVDFEKRKLIYPEAIKGRDRNDTFDAPENFVVFECVNRLLEKGYRPEHIELEKEWHLGHDAKSGRADICISSPDGTMLVIVECKTAGREFEKAYKDTLNDGGQLFSYWQQEQATKWLVLYASDLSGDEITYKAPTINCTDDPNIVSLAKKDKNIRLYSAAHTAEERFAVWKETYTGQIHDNLVFSPDTKAYKIGIRPLRKKDLRDFTPEDRIVNRFEEILRHNNVSDKENAFNRLVALFICKLVDEITKSEDDVVEFQYKQGTDTYETLQDRLQRLHQEGMEKFMREKIFYVPSDYPEWLFTTYTGRQREKAIEDLKEKIRILKFYSNNDFSFKDVHNEELFYQNGKILVEVVQLFEQYRIVYPSKHQFLGDLFEQLLNKGFKQNEGQFFTPMPITRFIWDCLPLDGITHTEKGIKYPKVIDYACGAGHFLTEAVEAINASIGADGNNAWVRDHIFGIEKDYRLARVSKISLFMNGAGEGNIIFGDGLENAPEKQIENGSFDVLVANPPYAVAAFKAHLQLKNNSFELLDRISSTGSEIEVLFVERIAQLLKPGGIAAVILPSSILSNDSGSYMGAREHLLKNFHIRAIVQFGSKTFGATGTNTVVLFLEKYKEPPKRMDMVTDSINAIMSGDDLTEWEDRDIYDAYVAQIGVDAENYRRFLKGLLDEEQLAQIEYFKMYADAFYALTETKNFQKSKQYQRKTDEQKQEALKMRFHEYACSTEREKLFYFAMTYRQNTVIITAPADNAGQKEFLGYDWSNRKGAEGIQILAPGGKLYCDADRKAEDTLAHAVRKSYINDVLLPETAKSFVRVVRTADMLEYERPQFNKSMKPNTDKKSIQIISAYPMRKLDDIKVLLKRGKSPNYGTSNIQIIKSGQARGFTSFDFTNRYYQKDDNTDERKLQIGDILINSTGKGTAGRVTLFELEGDYVCDSHITILRCNDEVLPRYVLMVLAVGIGFVKLESMADGSSGQIELAIDTIKNIKIPVPPIPIQEQVVAECKKIDEEYTSTRMSIDEYRSKISAMFDELEVIARDTSVRGGTSLRDLVAFNPSKSEVRDLADTLMVSFVEMASVSNDGYIESMIDRPLGEVKTGSYTYFAENDIIVAKITPCMENGKCAVAAGLTNGIAFGSSEFHVLRCNDRILSKFVFGFINREKVRQEAAKQMTGSSGHRRVPVSFYESMVIPVIPMDEQVAVVNKVAEYEAKITAAEQRLKELEGKRTEILQRFLN